VSDHETTHQVKARLLGEPDPYAIIAEQDDDISRLEDKVYDLENKVSELESELAELWRQRENLKSTIEDAMNRY
jgi:peptidoglycan hydrolase CwlO-like protein